MTDNDNILTRVYKGMTVYDGAGRPIGIVDQVCLGGVNADSVEHSGSVPVAPQVNISGSGASIANVQYVDDLDVDLPEELRDHLLRTGYLRVREDVVAATTDYYVMPGQITRVGENNIRLNLPVDQLVRA
ncbi:MAG: hypothetical protein K8I30_00480 [Anaerolineae bacterium]|nr:hypothetical protein [Anaerolineae bacterium]